MTKFFVDGEPQGKLRHRFSKGRAYTPRKTKQYEEHIARYYEGGCLAGAVFVHIIAFMPIPKSYTKAQKNAIRCKFLLPTKKPDADNIGKVVMDALNGIAYEDDKQVVDLHVVKEYSENKTGLEITIGEA